LGLLSKAVHGVVEWGARAACLLAIGYSLYLIYLQNFWIAPLGSISSFSLASAAVLYLLSQYQFARDGWSKVDSIVLGALFASAFLATYNIIYHFTFPIYSSSFPFILGSDLKFLIIELAMAIPVFLVRKNLSFKRSSLYALVAFAASMILWILFGFPQYYSGQYFVTPLIRMSDAYHVSLIFNFSSLVIFASFFATLLNLWRRAPRSVWGRTSRVQAPPVSSAH